MQGGLLRAGKSVRSETTACLNGFLQKSNEKKDVRWRRRQVHLPPVPLVLEVPASAWNGEFIVAVVAVVVEVVVVVAAAVVVTTGFRDCDCC